MQTVGKQHSGRNRFRYCSKCQCVYHYLRRVSVGQDSPQSIQRHLQSSMFTSGFPRRAVLEINLTTANAKELVIRKLNCRGPSSERHLRKTEAHQGHRTELLPCRHLQAPDDNARIDGEGNVHECGDACEGCLSKLQSIYHDARSPKTYR